MSESNGENGEEIRRLEREADRIAKEIDGIEENMGEDDSPHHGDVVRLAQLNAQFDELEAEVALLRDAS